MGLRARLIVMVVGLVSIVVLVISWNFISRHQTDRESAMAARSEVMRDGLRRKGRLMARSVALSSQRAIVVSDFLFLKEVIGGVVKDDAEFTYGILMSEDGLALVHSDSGKMFSVLDGAADRFAAAQTRPAEQERSIDGIPHLEIIEPIDVGRDHWGALRFGLSLDGLNKSIVAHETQMRDEMGRDLRITVVTAIALLLLASFLGSMASTRLVRPLHQLLSGVRGIAAGNLDSEVRTAAGGGPEIANLVKAFNVMSHAVRERDEALRRNMTELAEALAAAKEASRLKSEFVANVSHELRTPLNAIVNIPSSLVLDCEPAPLWVCPKCNAKYHPDTSTVGHAGSSLAESCPDCNVPMALKDVQQPVDAVKFRHFLGILMNSGKHLLQVVNDILDFSKLDAGKLKLFPEEFKISDLIENVRQTLETLAHDKGLEVVYQMPPQALAITADRVKLMQIFINLVGNAIKFTPRGGRITVEVAGVTRGQTPYVQFSISDTGIGIPADKIGTLFESFRQVDGSHTRQHGGTGLGLSITKKLVELHGGVIDVTSTIGKGSNFVLKLPVNSTYVQPDESSKDKSGAQTTKLRVLLVDDDPVQLQLTGMVLKRDGIEMIGVVDPAQCLETVRETNPDVVVLDVMMPGISGLDLLKSMKADPAMLDVPVIVCTAYHANEDLARQYGAAWIPKPWSSHDFVQSIYAAVKQRPVAHP